MRKMATKRKTKYADEITTAEFKECRIERIFVKAQGQEEIRFSWWPEGRMKVRPLDMPESELLPLMERAIEQGVFSTDFLRGLLDILAAIPELQASDRNA